MFFAELKKTFLEIVPLQKLLRKDKNPHVGSASFDVYNDMLDIMIVALMNVSFKNNELLTYCTSFSVGFVRI